MQHLAFMGKAFWHNSLFKCELDASVMLQIFLGKYLTGSIKFSFIYFAVFVLGWFLLEISKIPYLDCWQ